MRYSRDGYTLPELLFFISVMGVSAAFFSPTFNLFRHAGHPIVLAAAGTIGMIVVFWIVFAGGLWAIAGVFKLLFRRCTPWRAVFHDVLYFVSMAWLAFSFIVVVGMAVWYVVDIFV